MAKENIEKTIFTWIITFIFSFFLFQALEEFITSQPDFVFKNIILLILPGPEDSVIELIQFLLYWSGAVYLKFFKD